MTNLSPKSWRPTRLLRVVEDPYDTSTGTTKIKTDATYGYLKALGNRQGPHVLVSEWIASSIALWFGLTVPDFAIFPLLPEACFSLKHPINEKPSQLIVISTDSKASESTESRFERTLEEFFVRFIPYRKVEEFAQEVQNSAHTTPPSLRNL